MKGNKREILVKLQAAEPHPRYGRLYERLAEALEGQVLSKDNVWKIISGQVRFWLTCTPLADNLLVWGTLLPKWLVAVIPEAQKAEMEAFIAATFPKPN